MYSINLLVLVIFVVLSILLVKTINKPHKWIGLLITSGLFYFHHAEDKIWIPLTIWMLTYIYGRNIIKNNLPLWPITPLILAPLLIFKVTNSESHFESFAASEFMTDSMSWPTTFHVIGISYFTFLAISYLIDVKRGYLRPETNPFKLLFFLIYFPTIFSGPLHRFKYLSNQFEQIQVTDTSVSNGMRLIIWGIFKNLVVAPRLFIFQYSILVNNDISGYYYLLCGLIFFLFLFVNFSSFIDLFQGVSEIFNIRLKANFGNRVYLSHSRQHFWSQWHITLNEWFRDYFFFPMAKKKVHRYHVDMVLLFTFLMIAAWHEISLIMGFWGLLNGVWIIVEKKIPFLSKPKSRLTKIGGTIYHLTGSALLAMIFITPSFSHLIQKLFDEPYFPVDKVISNSIPILIFCFFIMDFISLKSMNERIDSFIGKQTTKYRWFLYTLLCLIILIFGKTSQIENYYNQF